MPMSDDLEAAFAFAQHETNKSYLGDYKPTQNEVTPSISVRTFKGVMPRDPERTECIWLVAEEASGRNLMGYWHIARPSGNQVLVKFTRVD